MENVKYVKVTCLCQLSPFLFSFFYPNLFFQQIISHLDIITGDIDRKL